MMGTKQITKYRFKDQVAGESWILAQIQSNVLTTDAFDKWAIENHTREIMTKGASTPILGANASIAYSSISKTVTLYKSITDLEKKLENDGKEIINNEIESRGIDYYIKDPIKTLPNDKVIVIKDK